MKYKWAGVMVLVGLTVMASLTMVGLTHRWVYGSP
jgi:hypothetical protein